MASGIAPALVDDDARAVLAVEDLLHEMLVFQSERPRDASGRLAGEMSRKSRTVSALLFGTRMPFAGS